MGGKPSKGTPKDRRLRENRPKRPRKPLKILGVRRAQR